MNYITKQALSSRAIYEKEKLENELGIKSLKDFLHNQYWVEMKNHGEIAQEVYGTKKRGTVIRKWLLRLGIEVRARGVSQRKSTAQFKDDLFSMYGEEYEVIGKYVTSKDKIDIKHKVCGGVWNVTPNDALSGRECGVCMLDRRATSIRHTNERYLKQLKDVLHEFEQVTDYIGADEPVKFIHKVCGRKFEVRAIDFAIRKRCPLCGLENTGSERRLSHERFLETLSRESRTNYKIISEYKNSRTPLKVKRNDCGHEFEMIPHDIRTRPWQCPSCSLSKGERKIKLFLDENEVLYERQYSFSECQDKVALRFDFVVFNRDKTIKMLIEFDGRQHYEPIEGWGGFQSYLDIRRRDLIKQQYCRNNGIRLVRVRYCEFDEINKMLKTLLL